MILWRESLWLFYRKKVGSLYIQRDERRRREFQEVVAPTVAFEAQVLERTWQAAAVQQEKQELSAESRLSRSISSNNSNNVPQCRMTVILHNMVHVKRLKARQARIKVHREVAHVAIAHVQALQRGRHFWYQPSPPS